MQASQTQNETRLPRAVLRRSEAINARIAARNESEAAIAANEPPAPPSPNAADPADPNPPPPAPPVDPRESDPAYWKQRFNVTAGVLRREREERQADAERFSQQMTELQGQIRALQASAPPAEVDLSKFLTPEQVSALGEDDAKTIVQTAVQAAREEVQKAFAAELKPLQDQRIAEQERAAADLKTQFWDKLAELVPDFEQVNETDEWKIWLGQDDEAAGVQRQALLNTHVGRLEAAKVAKMFEAYKATLARPAPPVGPSGRGAAPTGELPRPDPTAGQYPSAAEIKDFYKRAALGKVKDAERVKFEARLKLRPGA